MFFFFYTFLNEHSTKENFLQFLNEKKNKIKKKKRLHLNQVKKDLGKVERKKFLLQLKIKN